MIIAELHLRMQRNNLIRDPPVLNKILTFAYDIKVIKLEKDKTSSFLQKKNYMMKFAQMPTMLMNCKNYIALVCY